MFTQAFNQFAALGWDAGIANATKLHFLAYYPVRAALPDLNSNLTNTARTKAAESLRSAFALQKLEKVSMPCLDDCPPRYNAHPYTLDEESQTIRMSLSGGWQTIRFTIPSYSAKYAFHPTDTADLIFRHGRWWKAS